MQLQELRMAKKRLFEGFIRYEARQVAALIRNTPETSTTQELDQQPALSDPETSSAQPAEDPRIEERPEVEPVDTEDLQDQEQVEETVITDAEEDLTSEDLAPEEPTVKEAANLPTSLDAQDLREEETEQEPTMPSEIRSTAEFEVSNALKVRMSFLIIIYNEFLVLETVWIFKTSFKQNENNQIVFVNTFFSKLSIVAFLTCIHLQTNNRGFFSFSFITPPRSSSRN